MRTNTKIAICVIGLLFCGLLVIMSSFKSGDAIPADANVQLDVQYKTTNGMTYMIISTTNMSDNDVEVVNITKDKLEVEYLKKQLR